MLTTTRRRDDPPHDSQPPGRKRHLVGLPATPQAVDEPRSLAERAAIVVTLFLGFQIALLALLGL
jgi:hypothetical protein